MIHKVAGYDCTTSCHSCTWMHRTKQPQSRTCLTSMVLMSITAAVFHACTCFMLALCPGETLCMAAVTTIAVSLHSYLVLPHSYTPTSLLGPSPTMSSTCVPPVLGLAGIHSVPDGHGGCPSDVCCALVRPEVVQAPGRGD